jgi:hypothetical protein
MQTRIAVLAFVFSAVGLAIAQAPNAGDQSANSPDAQAALYNSGNPSGTQVSTSQDDASLQSQIQNALRNESSLGNSQIVVSVTAQGIDLSGTVGSNKDKQTAERISQSFDGNRKLNDNLLITGHGHPDLAPDRSAMNNGATGNPKNLATSQSGSGTDNPQSTPPQR